MADNVNDAMSRLGDMGDLAGIGTTAADLAAGKNVQPMVPATAPAAPPVSFPPPPQPQPQRQASPRRPPPRRPQAPQMPLQPLPPQQPQRTPLAWAFAGVEDVIQVYRVVDDRPTDLIGREFPRAYLESVRFDFPTFVLRHVVPDYGGGDYLVRGVTSDGTPVGETRVRIDGQPKVKNAQPHGEQQTFDQFGRAIQMGRDMNNGPRPKTIGDAISEVAALKSLDRMQSEGSEVAMLKQQIADLNNRLATVQTPVVQAPPPPPDPLDSMMKFMAFQKQMNPPAPAVDPSILALTDLVKRMDDRMNRMEEQRKADALDALVKQNQALIEELKRAKDAPPASGMAQFKNQFNEAQDLAQMLAPPGNSGFTEVVAKALESWTPDAIASMVERTTTAQMRARLAARGTRPAGSARATLSAKGEPLDDAPIVQKAPPLAAIVPAAMREKLLKAGDEAELLVAALPILQKLLEVPKMHTALAQLLGTLARGDQPGDEAFSKHIGTLIGLIYGKDEESEGLADDLAKTMVENRGELVPMLFEGAPPNVRKAAETIKDVKIESSPANGAAPEEKKVKVPVPLVPVPN